MKTLDEELVRRLCAELDSLTADVAAEPPTLGPTLVVTHVVEIQRRDRRRMIVLAAALVALIVAVAGLVAVRRDGGAVGTPDSSQSSAPVVTYATSPGVVHPTPPSPDGWDLVEWGNVRLSLPPELSPFDVGNGCVTTPSGGDLEIVCGDQLVRIQQAAISVRADETINGFHEVFSTGACARCQTLDVYELAATVTVSRDSESPRDVLDTVGASGSWRYENEPRPKVPAGWQTVAYQGASIRVPPDWQTVSSSDPGRDPCKIFANTVVLGPTSCAQPSLQPLTDGVRLFQGGPQVTPHPGWPEQQVTVQFDTAPSVVLEVGYGEDPSVGLAILNSLTAPDARETPKVDDHPLPDLPYLAVGESVMLGAKPMLEARGITTIADVSKGPPWMLEQLQLVKSRSHLTHGVVIQLGTNGSVTREQYEAVLTEVADVPRVVVLTVTSPHPWTQANNEIIRALLATHPNVVVLDWEARAGEIADHVSSDGVHLGDDVAKQFFTDLILQALGLPT